MWKAMLVVSISAVLLSSTEPFSICQLIAPFCILWMCKLAPNAFAIIFKDVKFVLNLSYLSLEKGYSMLAECIGYD